MKLLLLACAGLLATAADLDRDGLDDAFEQQILERFRPTLLLSAGECAGRPAEFVAGSAAPRARVRNGALYGRVFPIGEGTLEVQYFHLWDTDCGRGGHPLDVEHVSGYLRAASNAAPAEEWTALYWYAAAHQDTMCDASMGGKAASIGAVMHGPFVWVSRGKHASYFSPASCGWGCGGDVCKDAKAMPPGPLVNLGERGAPLNGAVWVESPQWNFASKFKSDFPPEALAQFEQLEGDKLISMNASLAPVKAVILGGDSTLDGLAIGQEHTGNALSTARKHTGGSLKKATRAVGGFLGKKKPEPAAETKKQ
jgi:hypothetical protein